jgi:DNA topoisomerase-3
LKNKKTALISGFKSKKGRKFSAYLYIDQDGKVKFEFENKKKK